MQFAMADTCVICGLKQLQGHKFPNPKSPVPTISSAAPDACDASQLQPRKKKQINPYLHVPSDTVVAWDDRAVDLPSPQDGIRSWGLWW